MKEFAKENAAANLSFQNFKARASRVALAVAGVVVSIGHVPETEAEWAGMVIAVLGGGYTSERKVKK